MNYNYLKKHDDEIIKPVKGYEENYLVSTYGRVFSRNYNKKKGFIKELALIKLKDNRIRTKSYYLRLKLQNGKKSNSVLVHRIVLESFIKKPHGKYEVNHKNGIKNDNRLVNLEWVTPSENSIHSIKNKIRIPPRGEKSGRSKISESTAIKIKKELNINNSPSQVAKKFNISTTIVKNIKAKKTWKHILD